MKPTPCHPFFKRLFALFACLFFTVAAYAADSKDMGGWEKDSPYNQHYNASEMDSFKGTVVGIKEIVPLKGMQPGIALLVQESGEDTTLVHLCPLWYADANAIGIRKGDRVKVKGVWAEIQGEDVFMASKVKKGDYFEFKVRLTKDGTPFWAMTPEERSKEQSGK